MIGLDADMGAGIAPRQVVVRRVAAWGVAAWSVAAWGVAAWGIPAGRTGTGRWLDAFQRIDPAEQHTGGFRKSQARISGSRASAAIAELNTAAERIFGFRRADVLGRPAGETLVPPDPRNQHRVGLDRYLSSGQPHLLGQRNKLDAMRADGTIVPAELTMTEVMLGERQLFTALPPCVRQRACTGRDRRPTC